MAQIRLENITKVFRSGPGLFMVSKSGSVSRRTMGDLYKDRAFVERAVASQDESAQGQREVRALDDLSLTINDGETISIVGPSGCGKSTLLRVVAGLELPDAGQVYYNDKPMNEVPPKDRGIGMVFQSYALYPHMEGEGNLAFYFRVRKRPTEEMMERIRITSEIMGIGFDALLDRRPKTLSGGQQQRLAIGRCIVREPQLFLFDEPLSNLDAKLRASTRIEIKRLMRRFAITGIYVTHDQTEAITLGDRVAVMRAGKIEQLGTHQELMSHPVSSFVAGFLGLPPMNLMRDWRVTEDGDAEGALGRVALPKGLRDGVSVGQKVLLGFRSDEAHVTLEGEPVPVGEACLRGTVINAEPHFALKMQLVNVQAGDLIVGVRAPMDMRINMGWPVQVLIPASALYLFDQESDRRIAPESTT